MVDQPIHVIKLGGSLLDLPDLPQRWAEFCDAWLIGRPLLIVGGGSAADTVRDFDHRFHLDEPVGHRLAVHAMQFNARIVASVLESARFVADLDEAEHIWVKRHTVVLDPVAWLNSLEKQGVDIPQRWVFTSDSIAALTADVLRAERLTLLKSTLPPVDCDASEASRCGVVDESFPDAIAGVASVDLVNLRHVSVASPDARCVWQ